MDLCLKVTIMEKKLSLIRVYGDSLSLPRIFEGVAFDATYPEQITRALETQMNRSFYLYNRSRFDANIKGVYSDFYRDSLNFGIPGGRILIIQCGVCDCAPRPIPPLVRRFIGKLPLRLKKSIVTFIHNNRSKIQRICFWRTTSILDFESTYFKLLEEGNKSFQSVYVINIPPTNSNTEDQSPGFSASILAYNSAIFEVIKRLGASNIYLIDVFSKIKNSNNIDHFIVKADGHHITKAGHDLYAQLILEKELG